MRIRLLHTESFRLAALFTAVFAACMAILGLAVLALTGSAMREQILQYSRADVAAINDGYVHEGVHEAREVTLQRMAAVGETDFVLLQQNGEPIVGNLPAMPEQLGEAEIPSPALPHHVILGFGARLGPGLYAFAGSDLSFVAAVRHRILNLLLWLFAGAMCAAVLCGFLIGRGFLARMDAIARTCSAIMAGNLRNRIPLRGSQDELDRLSAVINAMLDRIAALMDNLRQVSNDIAHDLRTPLTHLRQKLERVRYESRSLAEYETALDGAIASADEMLSLFAALLRIAQIEGGARRAGFGAVDLASSMAKLRDVYGAVAEDSGYHLVLESTGSCPVQGDPELLFQMMANLVENALVHTPPGTTIRVSLKREERRMLLTVQDDGPGVPADDRQKLFRRFFRLDASRSTPGHGLGLALVAAVAELHGGTVTAASGPQGQGLAVTLALPLAL